jgi:uncharacterized phage infection (PIP) family protein YhgE
LFGYLNLGNQTVEFLKKDSFLNIHEFNNLESAINSVKEEKNWGVLYIDREFSKAFFFGNIIPQKMKKFKKIQIWIYI